MKNIRDITVSIAVDMRGEKGGCDKVENSNVRQEEARKDTGIILQHRLIT